jgi:hypothetical protein
VAIDLNSKGQTVYDLFAQKEIKDPWSRYCQIMLCSTEFATVE